MREKRDQIRFLKHKTEMLAAERAQIDECFGTIKHEFATDHDLP
jgi:hypothetical protein